MNSDVILAINSFASSGKLLDSLTQSRFHCNAWGARKIMLTLSQFYPFKMLIIWQAFKDKLKFFISKDKNQHFL